ncbi:MAG: hypothetical protein HY903_17980 [Deltaproteobacteria bacterium]|nr:hypothetical protein [Deltaproteobacteria bacterium]
MGLTTRLALSVVAAAWLSAPVVARANPYDISVRGLGRPATNSLTDPAVLRYRALTSELALSLAPRPLAPAETLGLSGFEFSLVSTLAGISSGEAYWQGQPGSPIIEGALPSHGSRAVPSALWVPSLHVRKGLPFSTEIGINGSYLAFSEMVNAGVEAKVALHESYFRYAPALSFRAAGSRLFGATDFGMITVEGDAMTSLAFGVGGMAQVTPYAGYGLMYAQIDHTVIDETPYKVLDANDQQGGPSGSLYSFPTLDWNENQHSRIFGGLRINVAMLELLYEFDFGMVGFNKKQLISHSFKLGLDV